MYISLSANANIAEDILVTTVCKLQSTHPEVIFIVAGDFIVLTQHVTWWIRSIKLWAMFTVTCREHTVSAHPPLSHTSIPVIKRSVPTVKTITIWPASATSPLQGYFEHIEWALISQQNCEDFNCTVLHYIKTCIDSVAVERQIKCYQNNKTWMKTEVNLLLKCFQIRGYGVGTDWSNLKAGIREAKPAYKRKIEEHFNEGDPNVSGREYNTSLAIRAPSIQAQAPEITWQRSSTIFLRILRQHLTSLQHSRPWMAWHSLWP